ncbi:hypothetical protein RI129_009687 [Pyrocoelia pectoralis]|uniref:Uncharacterized protein n=1 Tax=Pyrocoelia pectoralis TaxID=417401 RepID=A0AAN7V2R5_9COLE
MSKRSKGNESSLKTNYKGSKEHGGRVRTMLARLSAQDLKGIKVVIRRPYLPDLPTSTPPIIETSLDDPTGLIIHRAVGTFYISEECVEFKKHQAFRRHRNQQPFATTGK